MYRSILGSAGLKILNAILGFAIAVVLARKLGADGYGIYSTAFVSASVLAIVVQFGLSNLVTRETASAKAASNWGLMYATWAAAARASTVLSILVVLAGAAILMLRWDQHPSEVLWTYAIALLTVPLLALASLRAGALRGLQRIVLSQLPELLAKPVTLLVLALLLLGSALPAEPQHAMAMQLAAVAAAFLIGTFLLLRHAPPGPRNLTSAGSSTPRLRPALDFAFVAGAVQLNQYADIFVLSAFRSQEEVGIYRATWQVSQLIAFGTSIAAVTAAPLFAKYYAQSNFRALRGALNTARGVGAAFAVPLCVVALLKGQAILGSLFGPTYDAGASALTVLALLHVANALVGPMGALMSMTGHERSAAKLHGLSALLNVLLNLMLVPTLGILGAATATFTAYIALNILLFLHLRSARVGLRPKTDIAETFDPRSH